jgi:DNA-binding transcriptional MerR regulator
MNISQLSEKINLSIHTLRYYEKLGLLKGIQRNSSGHRVYTAGDLLWLEFILRLKETGMPLNDILEYSLLRDLGVSTNVNRQMILENHRAKLQAKIELEIQHLTALNKKIEYYQSQNKS